MDDTLPTFSILAISMPLIPWLRSQSGAVDLPIAVTDDNGRSLGVEDPEDERLRDDPSIFVNKYALAMIPVTALRAATVPTVLPKSLLPARGVPFLDPRTYGGAMLNQSAGLGEPLNVIVSALSSPELLTRKGLQGYLRSLDFDMECLGLHQGAPQRAFIDPRGWVDENFLYREVYTPFDHLFGTCIESLRGGNHLRAWQQQGTGAWFFATSREEDLSKHHMIVPNGYNIGRDLLVQQSASQKNGVTSFMFTKYQTKVEYLTGLIQPGAQGVNHNVATDGRVALLTVKLLSRDDKALLKAKQRAVLQIIGVKTAEEAPPANYVPPKAQRAKWVQNAVSKSYSSKIPQQTQPSGQTV